MKLLLDEHFAGSKEFYEILKWDVTTVQDEGLAGKKDREVVEYAKAKGFLLVTMDDQPDKIAQLIGAKCFRITDAMIAEMASNKIRLQLGEK